MSIYFSCRVTTIFVCLLASVLVSFYLAYFCLFGKNFYFGFSETICIFEGVLTCKYGYIKFLVGKLTSKKSEHVTADMSELFHSAFVLCAVNLVDYSCVWRNSVKLVYYYFYCTVYTELSIVDVIGALLFLKYRKPYLE